VAICVSMALSVSLTYAYVAFCAMGCRQVDRAKGRLDSTELFNLKQHSSTLPANFELVALSRKIEDRFPCRSVDASTGQRLQAFLTLCNDCAILDRRFAFGPCVVPRVGWMGVWVCGWAGGRVDWGINTGVRSKDFLPVIGP
jgi:hypothetical protein